MMGILEWMLLVSLCTYVCLGAVAFKYPRGRENWTRERKETLYLALSITVFLMLLFLLWYVSSVIDWPSALTVMLWASAAALCFLVAISIFMPHGFRFTFKKREKRVSEEED
jgi:presenilin-like A22 family membrane protease